MTVQGADHPDLADYLSREGSVLTAMNKVVEAEPVLVRAIEVYRNAYGPEALPLLERALTIREHAHVQPPSVAETHFYLGAALVGTNKARALQEIHTALELYTQAGDPDDVREMQTWLAKHR